MFREWIEAYIDRYIARGGGVIIFIVNYMRLRNIVNLTVENDIPIYANLNAASTKIIRQLLYIIAQSIPLYPLYLASI